MRGLAAVVLLAGCWQPRLRLDPPAVPAARVGSPYRMVMTIHEAHTPVGGVSATSLPPGLAIEHVNMEDAFTITGTPTAAGDFHAQLSAWCYGTNYAGQRLEKDLLVHVLPR